MSALFPTRLKIPLTRKSLPRLQRPEHSSVSQGNRSKPNPPPPRKRSTRCQIGGSLGRLERLFDLARARMHRFCSSRRRFGNLVHSMCFFDSRMWMAMSFHADKNSYGIICVRRPDCIRFLCNPSYCSRPSRRQKHGWMVGVRSI